jgi:hypothetical protein
MIEHSNEFSGGLDRGTNERTQMEKTIFDSVNGQLYFDHTGNVIWRPYNGNTRMLVFDCEQDDPITSAAVDTGNSAVHTPIGGCSFADCFIVITVRQTSGLYDPMIIWLFQENVDGEVYGQVLLSDVASTDKFNQKISNNIRMRPIYENDELYRIKWVDGVEIDSNPPRSLTFSKTGTVTGPTYNGATVTGRFSVFTVLGNVTPTLTNLMAPFKMGYIHFLKRVKGQIASGRYIYLYREILEDGYRTPWSHHTNPVFVSVDIQNGTDMHLYEMEGSNEVTVHGNRLGIYGVDIAYQTLEVAYVYIPDDTNIPTVAASFAFIEINGQGYIEVDHTSMSGEILNVAEIIALRLNMTAAQTLEIKDEHLWHGNYKAGSLLLTNNEIEKVLEGLKVIHIFRDMPIDRKGKTDKFGNIDPINLFNLPLETRDTKFALNDVQEFTFPIDDDYCGYRGQQIDNTYVGYPRDEVGRFGIVFYDLVGNPTNVEHFCDYYWPKMYLGGDGTSDPSGTPVAVIDPDLSAKAFRIRRDDSRTLTGIGDPDNILDLTALSLHKRSWLTTGGADVHSISDPTLERAVVDGDDPLTDTMQHYTNMPQSYARIQGIKFSGIDISDIRDKISGYAIVRCPIEYSTIAQGLISPTSITDDQGDEERLGPWPRPNLAFRDYGIGSFGVAPSDNHGEFRASGYTPIRLWDRQEGNGVYLNGTSDFFSMYIPEMMFGSPMPSYNQGQKFELVQVCWEEYNCGQEDASTLFPTGLLAPVGPYLSNNFALDKHSWHLLVNTRIHHFNIPPAPASQPYSWNFHSEDQGIPFDATNIMPAALYASSYGVSWGTLGQAEALFPTYGTTFTPDWLRKIGMNEKEYGIDPSYPARFFHNMKWYYHPSDYDAPTPADRDRHDDYYGGFRDYANLLADYYDQSKRQAVGHDNTILLRNTIAMKDWNGTTSPCRHVMAFPMPTWAYETLGGSAVPSANAYAHDAKRGATARWMVNWKRELGAPYGGNFQNNLQYNIFIGTGHFQPVGNDEFDTFMGATTPDRIDNAEVWGGECWLDLHAGTFMYPGYAHDKISDQDSTGYSVDSFGFILAFPHEARINLALRNAPSPGNPMSPHAGLRSWKMYNDFAGAGSSPWTDKGLFHYSGLNGDAEDASKHLIEEFFINEVMGYRDKFKGYTTIPRGFRSIKHWPQRWAYSNKKIYGEIADVFREVLIANYRDLDGSFGAIMASANHADKIISFQELAYGQLRIYERTIIPSTEGQLTTGDASVIDGIKYSTDQIGCQHPESVVITPDGVYWVDCFAYSIFFSQGEDAVNLSDKAGMNQYLRELLWRYVGGRSIYGEKGVAIVGGYDQRTKRVTMSFPSIMKYQVHSRSTAPFDSNRYNWFGPVYTTVAISGNNHQRARVKPLDKGSDVAQDITNGYVHISNQDILVIHTLGYGAVPAYLYVDLYQGIYGSDTITPLSNTVTEFYLVLPGKTGTASNKGWVVEFANYREGSPDLTTPDIVTPLATTVTEKEGYVYHNAIYPHTPPSQSIATDSDAAVFHLFRAEKDSPFQVRLIQSSSSFEDVGLGIQMRNRMVYNEEFKAFESFISAGDIFNINFRKKRYAAIETSVTNGMYVDDMRSPEVPKLYGKEFESYLEFVANTGAAIDKIFDALRLDSSDLGDVKSVRYTNENNAVLIIIATDSSVAYIRRINRIPIRRKWQLSRVTGHYLRVMVEINGKRNKLAYVFTARTLFRLSNKN